MTEVTTEIFECLKKISVVITGGSAKMEGAVELAEEVFHMPVRLGAPQYVNGLMDVVRNPIHATGVGLLLYGFESIVRRNQRGTRGAGSVADRWGKVKSWFQGQY